MVGGVESCGHHGSGHKSKVDVNRRRVMNKRRADHLAEATLRGVLRRRKQARARARMSPEARERADRAERRMRRRLAKYFDQEAEEAPSDEGGDGEAEEPGYRRAWRDLLPRDSVGRPYLIYHFPTMRLGNIRSREWEELSLVDQARVRRRAVKYHRIKFMLEGRL